MFAAISLVLFAVAISAGSFGSAGGGGGSSTSVKSFGGFSSDISPAYIISDSEADAYRTEEYRQQWGLEAIHAAQAYAVLAKNGKTISGDGVKIAFSDSGVEASHQDVASNLNSSDSYNYYQNNADFSDSNGRGTYAASLAAGVKNESGIHGVAYNAKIVAAKSVDFATNNVNLTEAISGPAAISGVKIINASWKYRNTANGSYYTSYNGTASGASANDNLVLAGLEVAKTNDILLVAAVGDDADNAGDGQFAGQDANYLTRLKPLKPALMANNDEYAGYVLAVAAVSEFDPYAENPTVTIADFSNVCGVARNYCLVAPGVDIYGAASNVNAISGVGSDDAKYAVMDATAAAAAQVSGAAAVLRAAWPHLTTPQTAQILLSTATHLGTASAGTADAVYGMGMLNLYAAVQAQGSNNLGYGTAVANVGYDVRDSSFVADPIFGDALVNNVVPALNNAIFFDDYGRDYKAFLGNKISSKPRSSMASGLNDLMLNHYKTNIIPFSFNAQNPTQIKFQIKSYSDNRSKFIIVDNSREDKALTTGNGFSFRQNFSQNSQFGFAFNIDEIKNSGFEKSGFISTNALASNPYQSFLSGDLQNNISQRNFNQFFFDHKLFEQKLKLGFSLQTSYDSTNIQLASARKQNQIYDFNLSFAANKKTNFAISFGELSEFNNNFLNSRSLGAFESSGNSKTSYVKISATRKLFKDIILFSSISDGITKTKGNEIGIFRSYQDIHSRSSSIGLINENALGGRIGIIYFEPLRVYKGKANIDIPVALDNSGNVVRYQDAVSLKPKGHERNIEFYYSRNLQPQARIGFNFLMTEDAGNIKSSKNDYLWMINYDLVY